MSPLVALFGHALISELSLLSGAKRTLDLETPKGRAKPTFGRICTSLKANIRYPSEHSNNVATTSPRAARAADHDGGRLVDEDLCAEKFTGASARSGPAAYWGSSGIPRVAAAAFMRETSEPSASGSASV